MHKKNYATLLLFSYILCNSYYIRSIALIWEYSCVFITIIFNALVQPMFLSNLRYLEKFRNIICTGCVYFSDWTELRV